MKITIEVDDDSLQELAAAIASKLQIPAGAGAGEVDDFAGGAVEEEAKIPTAEECSKLVVAGVAAHGKETMMKLVKKHAGVDKVKDIPEDKRQAVLDELAKLDAKKKK